MYKAYYGYGQYSSCRYVTILLSYVLGNSNLCRVVFPNHTANNTPFISINIRRENKTNTGQRNSVGHYSTQSSGSNTPATFFVILLYSSIPLLYSLLYSETHYSTQKVAGVTKNS